MDDRHDVSALWQMETRNLIEVRCGGGCSRRSAADGGREWCLGVG